MIMMNRLLQIVEDSARKPAPPKFQIGDTVTVNVRIVEGDKERIQAYTGVVIGRRGKGMGESFTVRRIVNNEGVERIFPLHSPKIASIEVVRSGHVRRAKLYYLRDRVGKSRRIRDKKKNVGTKASGATAETAAPVGAGA
jgi:large subunit ribosomal protein L19